jgi:hypothetical protein
MTGWKMRKCGFIRKGRNPIFLKEGFLNKPENEPMRT